MLTVTIRTIVVYLLLVLAVRLMGKRQLGELQPTELVTTILISNLASLPIEEVDLPIVSALAPIFIIVCLEIIVSVLEIKNAKIGSMVSGNSMPVIKDGVIDQDILRRLRFSIGDLLEALRNKDIFDVREVEYAIIETNGQLNVYKKHAKQNVLNESLNIQQDAPSRPPVAIVIDGKTQPKALAFCNRDAAWLKSKLCELDTDIKDIMLLQCDSAGECHLVKRSI